MKFYTIVYDATIKGVAYLNKKLDVLAETEPNVKGRSKIKRATMPFF